MTLTAVQISLLVVVLSLICPCRENDALAFEAGGFKTGMGRNEVALAFKSSRCVQKVDPSTLIYIDTSGNKSSYDLCNGTLVSMEQPRKTDFRQFISLVKEYTEKYGQPVLANDDDHPVPLDAIDAVGLRWKVDEEYVSLYFTSFSAGDELRVFYQSQNTCYKFPR
jgi:hypothetical protein